MTNNWQTKKLGEVATVIGGYAFKSKELQKDKRDNSFLPVVKIGNLGADGCLYVEEAQFHKFDSKFQSFLIRNNDVLIAMTGATVGKVAISDKNNLLLNQRVGIVRPKHGVLNEYVRYLLLNRDFYRYCQKKAGGGAQGNISPTQILLYSVNIPSLPAQQQIVEKLDAIRKLQELNNKEIEKAKTLFDSFVTNQLVTGKDVRLYKFNDIAKFQYGLTAEGKDEGNYRLIRITDIDEGGQLRNFDKKFVNIEEKATQPYTLRSGDLLVARTGATYGKFLLFDSDSPSVFASYLIKVTPDPEVALSRFFWLFTRTERYWIQARKLVTGSGQPQFNANRIKQIEISLPSLNRQKEIITKAEHLLNYSLNLRREGMVLEELFESALSKLMRPN